MKKAQKLIAILFVAVLVALFCFAGCAPKPAEYNVTFVSESETVKTVAVKEGEKLAESDIPSDPVKEGFSFAGWFNGEEKLDISKPITADITYTAKFVEMFTVKFVNGSETSKSVEVKSGEKLAESDVPADPEKEGFNFKGWFNGEEQLDLSKAVTADVTYTARFDELFTVTFVNGEEVVKTVEVANGGFVPDEEIPADLDATEEFAFGGWFCDGKEFDESVAITGDIIYTAQWNRTHFAVTFGTEVVYISVDNAVITEDIIPSAPAGEGVFAGWYKDGEKLVAGAAVTENVTYTAVFVSEADYKGVWFNAEEALSMFIQDGVFTIPFADVDEETFTFDGQTGEMTWESSYPTAKYSVFVVGNTMTFKYSYWDDIEETMITNEYTLTRAEQVDYAGTYLNGRSEMIVTDGGVLTKYYIGIVFGLLTEKDGTYTLTYKEKAEDALTTATVTVDEKGNFVIAGADSDYRNGIFVKADEVKIYENYISGEGSWYLYDYTVGQEHQLIFRTKDNVYSYATIDGTLDVGNILTITAGGEEYIVMIDDESGFIFPGAERGEYSGAVALSLDGFGNAVLGGGEPVSYVMASDSIAIIESKGYQLNLTDKTYTEMQTIEGGIEGLFKLEGSTYYSADFYNFGVLVFHGGSYDYNGTYTVADGKLTVDDVNYYIDGTWTIEESGNVLVSEDGQKVYIKEGYEVVDQSAQFEGWYVDESGNYVNINTKLGMISYMGSTMSYSKNYNGTVLTFEAKDAESYFPDNSVEFKVTISGDTLTIVHERITDYDSTYEEYITETITETFTRTEEPTVELDAFAGKWVDSNKTVYIFDGKGTVVADGSTFAYTVEADGTAKYNNGGYDVTCTLTETGLSLYFDDGYGETFTLTATFVEKDGFQGIWVLNDDSANYYQFRLIIDGYGNVVVESGKYPGNSYYNGEATYTIEGNKITFLACSDSEWTCTLNGDGTLTIFCIDEYGESVYLNNVAFTNLEGEEVTSVPESFLGEWTCYAENYNFKVTESSVSIDEYGERYYEEGTYMFVSYDAATMTITFSDNVTLKDNGDGTLTFTRNSETYTLNKM